MFSAITPTYDRLNLLFSAALDRRWRERAAGEAIQGLSPGHRLLDVATGTGDLARELARAAQAQNRRQPSPCHETSLAGNEFGIRVTGIDFTRSMLKRAVKKYGRAGFCWIEADGLRLPLADHSFDAVTIAFGLRNMADKPAALRELIRVARPGGRVVVLEFSQPQNRLFRMLYDFYSFRIMPCLGRWISGSNAYEYLAQSIRGFWRPDELADQMRRAGLTGVRAIPLTMGIVYMHSGVKPENGS
jgi:demethylmenaquinone methyltransferase/2-methoxy-6-polyprenyl-1,4-benzoquinol methylase